MLWCGLGEGQIVDLLDCKNDGDGVELNISYLNMRGI